MRFDRQITLISPGGYTQDAIGQQVASEPVERTIFANEWSLTASEYYAAGTVGMKPERVYEVRSCEYQDEQLAEADGVRFSIIRVDRRGEFTRLVLQRVIGNG